VQATDIQASIACVLMKQNDKERGKLITLKIAHLRRDFLPALSPIQYLTKEWMIPTTVTFITDEGQEMMDALHSPDEGEKRFVFTLAATDGVSGARVVQQFTYKEGVQPSQIKKGVFALGFEVNEPDSETTDLELV
jgi:hypothetical protein